MMLYTSIDKIKQHLTTVHPVSDRVQDQLLVLAGTDFMKFFGGAINEASLIVKSDQSNILKRQSVTLGNPTTSLPDNQLIRGSAVVASDSSLAIVYTENLDYIINYHAGELSIATGGSLTAGQTVIVWYHNFVERINNTDYILDASNGSIKRISSGNITSGETVYLDYSPVFQSYSDELLQNAVDEANSLIERTLDPDQQFGVDPTLQAAATYRALEIVSRSSAARELSSLRGEDRVALAWLKLSQEFSNRADGLLKSFRPPFEGPSAPAHT